MSFKEQQSCKITRWHFQILKRKTLFHESPFLFIVIFISIFITSYRYADINFAQCGAAAIFMKRQIFAMHVRYVSEYTIHTRCREHYGRSLDEWRLFVRVLSDAGYDMQIERGRENSRIPPTEIRSIVLANDVIVSNQCAHRHAISLSLSLHDTRIIWDFYYPMNYNKLKLLHVCMYNCRCELS